MESQGSATILGIWRLGSQIHQGDQAEIFLGQPADSQSSPRWDYVIKRASDAETNALSRKQISQFAAVAEDVAHPNLVSVLDSSLSGSSPYLVMPLVCGSRMQDQLSDDQRYPLPVALWMVRQAAEALSAMHMAGWVHGDVRPENVLVGSRGHVTLIDFARATRTHCVANSALHSSPYFAAPESLEGEVAALPASDVFSLGRILWSWLTKIDLPREALLEPVADLIGQMVSIEPESRPSAKVVANTLWQLEIDTLGDHLNPSIKRAA